MLGRMMGLFGLIAAFVLTAQLRGTSLVNPSPRTTVAIALCLVGVALLAAVVSGGLRTKRRKHWQPPPLGDNPRQTFRIVYPEGEQPRLLMGRGAGQPRSFQVVDLSEEGLRLSDTAGLVEDGEVAGELEFSDGRRAQVAGTVVRRAGDHVCLHLTGTVPPNLVVEEQLRLRKRERTETD
ncbi:MAG TPA: hypothetical protein VK997_01925 [Deferrisomatales bacterium]|nr:hypothetical protein [Deferrisomatales bacterium]